MNYLIFLFIIITSSLTHYDILNVSNNATIKEITKSYYSLAKLYHPDKHKNNKEYYTTQFQTINRAYEVLSDEDMRKTYDRTIKKKILDDIFGDIFGDWEKSIYKTNNILDEMEKTLKEIEECIIRIQELERKKIIQDYCILFLFLVAVAIMILMKN